MAKTQVLFTCSEAFKEALGTYAQQKGISASELIRSVVAKEIGYSFADEETIDGRKIYKNAEERKNAQKERQRTERATVKKLIELYNHRQHELNVLILQDSLERKGIDPDSE